MEQARKEFATDHIFDPGSFLGYRSQYEQAESPHR